jgi:hypothetical protein
VPYSCESRWGLKLFDLRASSVDGVGSSGMKSKRDGSDEYRCLVDCLVPGEASEESETEVDLEVKFREEEG